MKEKKWIKNFLDKLSEVNKEEFGDKALDCCELNKSSKDNGKNKTSTTSASREKEKAK